MCLRAHLRARVPECVRGPQSLLSPAKNAPAGGLAALLASPVFPASPAISSPAAGVTAQVDLKYIDPTHLVEVGARAPAWKHMLLHGIGFLSIDRRH